MTALALAASPEPDGDDYSALGVSDAEIGLLLHVAFSRLLGQGTGNRDFVRMLCSVLAGVGRLPFRRNDKTLVPAVAPDLPTAGWADGSTALRKLHLKPGDIDSMWKRAEAIDGIHAVLPLEVVLAFFPPSLWPVAEAIVSWGPGETAQRIERFWRLEAQRPIRPTRARPDGGTLAESTVRNGVSLGRRFPGMLCELRALEYPSVALDRWLVNPQIDVESLGAQSVHTDRSAPPLMLLRRTLRALHTEIEERRRTKRGAQYIQTLLRKRLLLALLAATGARIDAVSRASVRDYDPQHRFPDGSVGPALRIFPAKTMNVATSRWKALPEEVAGWLEEHLDFLEIRDLPDSPLWPSIKKPGEPMLSTSLASLIAGDPTEGDQRRPLLPREPESFDGYSAHTLRHLAEQYAYQAGSDYLAADDEARAIVTPQVFVDSLLDRAMPYDRLGYKDLNSPRSREKWARDASLGVWEYVWGVRGARRAPDVERIERAENVRDELRAELAAAHARIERLRTQQRELARQAERAEAATVEDLVRSVIQLIALIGSLDEEHEEAERVQRELVGAEIELRDARETLVPIPDDAPDPEQLATIDEEAEPLDVLVEVRDWLYPREAAEAFGVSAPTMRRWFNGNLPHPEGDPRNPWQPSEVSRVIQGKPRDRKRRLIVSQLDRSRIAPDVMKAIKELLRLPPGSPPG